MMLASDTFSSPVPGNFIFANKENSTSKERDHWNVLIVDDEPDVHKITQMVLSDFVYLDRSVRFHHAYSAKEAIETIRKESFALILLDVVMEDKNAGLEVVEFIRQDQKDPFTRIVLRTGQPGEAPEEKVIFKYEINDYLEKGDTSSRRLKTVLINSFRNYDMLLKQEESNKRQKQLSERLEKANNRLQQLNMEKSKFLTYLSHETMTPLNYISASTIIDRDSLPEKDRQYIDFIITGSQRLHEVIKAIIEYFDTVGTELQLNIEHIQVYPILLQILKKYICQMEDKQLNIHLDIAKDLGVEFDFDCFNRVMSTVIDNAVNFSSQKGTITIKGWMDHTASYLSIQDEGRGICDSKLQRVFKAYDLENFDRHEKGFGLNLPISHYIIESHDDEIKIESEGLNRGAVVTITFKHKLSQWDS